MDTPSQLIIRYRQSEDYFFKSISLKHLEINNAVTAYMTGVPVEELNLIYIRKTTARFAEIITKCRQFHEKDKIPFIVIIPKEICLSGVEDNLSSMGYIKTGTSAAMAIGLKDYNIVADFDNETRILPADNNLMNWMEPLIGAFDSSFDIGLQYANAHLRALGKECSLYHFVLYKQEQPVSSITLSMYENTSRIDDVSTLPEFQGRGYASCLINYALSESKKRGAAHCFLESSVSGFSIYKKLGFQTLFKNNIYSLRK
jgi:GNAT superfamily N-acetyltransferase